MKVVEMLNNLDLLFKSYPLFIIASNIKRSELQNDQEIKAADKLVGLANLFSYDNELSSKKEKLIQFSENLEVFADSNESLYDIQKELSSLTGIDIVDNQ